MAATLNRRVWLWAAVTVTALIAAVLVIAATTGAPSRDAVIAMLQRPAVPAAAIVPAPGGRASVWAGGVRYRVRLWPNRASVANRLEITALTAGRPLRNARITVGFSMPAMGMWHAFSLVLHPSGPGRYVAVMPSVGMSGAWRLDARLSAPRMPAAAFAISDALRS